MTVDNPSWARSGRCGPPHTTTGAAKPQVSSVIRATEVQASGSATTRSRRVVPSFHRHLGITDLGCGKSSEIVIPDKRPLPPDALEVCRSDSVGATNEPGGPSPADQATVTSRSADRSARPPGRSSQPAGSRHRYRAQQVCAARTPGSPPPPSRRRSLRGVPARTGTSGRGR